MEFLLIPLASALLYPLGTLLVKRAFQDKVDLWAAMAVSAGIQALLFLPLTAFDSRVMPFHLWWQAACVGALGFAGQALAFKAIADGDLTVATPAMGSKVLMVALLTEALLRQAVPMAWWASACLSFAAVICLQAGGNVHRRRVLKTLVFSTSAAFSFALGDVLIQLWAPGFGILNFAAALALTSATISLGLVPGLLRRRAEFASGTWKWLLPGAVLLAVQTLGVVFSIGFFGKATAVNIVYSSRGLWNFLLVWYLGGWFGNREREAGPRVMVYRLAGAALMFAAIVLVSI